MKISKAGIAKREYIDYCEPDDEMRTYIQCRRCKHFMISRT